MRNWQRTADIQGEPGSQFKHTIVILVPGDSLHSPIRLLSLTSDSWHQQRLFLHTWRFLHPGGGCDVVRSQVLLVLFFSISQTSLHWVAVMWLAHWLYVFTSNETFNLNVEVDDCLPKRHIWNMIMSCSESWQKRARCGSMYKWLQLNECPHRVVGNTGDLRP